MKDHLVFHHKNQFTLIVLKDVVYNGVPFYKYGIAFCHPTDQFCRRIGREIAAGRARKDETIYVFDTMMDSILREIYKINDKRVRKAGYSPCIAESAVESELFVHMRDIIKRKWLTTKEVSCTCHGESTSTFHSVNCARSR